MKNFLIATLFILPAAAFSADSRDNLSFTPIIGLERVQKFQPTPHMKTRAIFGARILYRLPISTLETEYTHAQDSSSDPVNNISYKDSEDKLRIGLRGDFSMGAFLSSHLRGGAQGRKNKHTKTISGVSSTTDSSSKIQPYVGTGIEVRIFQFFSLSADILMTYTPTDEPNLKDYELQPSLGINLRF